ncbi:MAG: adenosylcobinamide amidohydrolase [Bryobacterales bacterium]|nr:adenosylcobinamide amidohydrolase [Bryobacterales bacterium]
MDFWTESTEGAMEDWNLLVSEAAFIAERKGRFLRVRLLLPHWVLSSSGCNGGLRRDLRALINHHSCEGKDHRERYEWMRQLGRDVYHRHVCAEADVDPETAAVLGTAANMRYASLKQAGDEETRVTAIVTAGVQSNAAAAGDPARWTESEGCWKPVQAVGGTINIIVMINRPVAEATLAQAAMVMTEAKSAALRQLAVGSQYSADLATGTGTDQFCVAAAEDGRARLYSASTHVRLGEWIGTSVREATIEALRWQNGLEPSLTRCVFHALGRYGLKEERFWPFAAEFLSDSDLQLLRLNDKSVFYEPGAAAAAFAMAEVLDRIRYATLPPTCAEEALRDQGACMAAAIAAQPERWVQFRAMLPEPDPMQPARFAAAAICLGWAHKWKTS